MTESKERNASLHEKKSLLKQIARFGVTGGIAFIIDYGLLFVLTEFVGLPPLVSSAISFCVSVIFNYILSIIWVFDVSEGRNKFRDGIVFLILSAIGLGINQAIMALFIDCFGLWYMFAKIVATAVVMVWNFITRKLFLEKRE